MKIGKASSQESSFFCVMAKIENPIANVDSFI